MEKRIRCTFLLMAVAIFLLSLRLGYIQLYAGDELSAGARRQQAIPVYKKNDRGIIYDRNLTPLTNTGDGYYYLIAETSKPPAPLLRRINAVPFGGKGKDYTVYKSEIYSKSVTKILKEKYGAYVFCAGSRYSDEQCAVHLIGNLGSDGQMGVSGLEKMYQYRLSKPDAKIFLTGDGAGAPIEGLGLSQKKEQKIMKPSALVTTIDAALQQKTEKILKERKITGAAVICDVSKGEILTMASAPVFNPNRIEEYLHEKDSVLVNKAVSGLYPPGSVFKIVTAAAALESGKMSSAYQYNCTGEITVNGTRLICGGKPKGHGKLDMKQAFAVSCNCYFAHAAEIIGGEKLYDMAVSMGLSSKTLRNFPYEEEGNLPPESEYAAAGLSNFAIGQGSMLITPLQAAKIASVIASGGVKHPFSVSLPVKTLDEEGERRVMAEKTAEEVGMMMEEVMKSGTGAGEKTKVRTCGKTGSAEGALSGNEAVHGWFTGYFPAENPKYAVAIICEDGKTGSGSALPVFREIVDFLY